MKTKPGMAFFPNKYGPSIEHHSIVTADYERGAHMIRPHFEYWGEAHRWLVNAVYARYDEAKSNFVDRAEDLTLVYEMKPPKED